jgi:hypothetical protein
MQSIETAPRDGTPILIFERSHGWLQAWFAPGEWTNHHEYGDEYSGPVWVVGDDLHQFEVEEYPDGLDDGSVTHWMPLPNSPQDVPNED